MIDAIVAVLIVYLGVAAVLAWIIRDDLRIEPVGVIRDVLGWPYWAAAILISDREVPVAVGETKPTKLACILHVGTWGNRADELDGERLALGEHLSLRWPDGIIEDVTVDVAHTTEQISDHGHTNTAHQYTATVVIYHHGVKARVPIAGLMAARRR